MLLSFYHTCRLSENNGLFDGPNRDKLQDVRMCGLNIHTTVMYFGFIVGKPLASKATFQGTHHSRINTITKHIHTERLQTMSNRIIEES